MNTPNITLIVRIFVVVAIVEAAIMLAFSMAPTSVQLLLQQYPRTVIVLDIITLMLISSPIVYFWGIRPFVLAHSKTESLLIDSERRYGFLFAHLPQGVMVEDYSAVKKGVDQLLSEGIKDLETYLKNNPELLYELASKVRVVAANHALLELYGCDSLRELIAGEEDLPLWWNDDWLAFYASEIMSFTRNKKHKFEVSDTREDGSDFKTSVISIVPKGNEETWSKVLTLHEDITVRRQREQMILDNQSVLEKLVKERTAKLEAAFSATEQSEAFLAQCTEIAHLGYAIWDNDLDRDITVSKKLANIHGLTVEEYIDTVSSTERYLDFVVPDDRAKYLSYENMVFADFDDEVESVEYRIMRADGEIRYLHQRSQPIQVTSGQKNKEIVVIQDVTELKQAEINLKESLKALKKSETLRVQAANIANKARGDQERERKESAAQIIQASKLATLGEMATSVAHELNQPLNIIRLAAGGSRRKVSNGTADSQYLNNKLNSIEEATTRAAAIIDHMRMFGREAKEAPELTDPREVVTNALDLMGAQLRLDGIEIVSELAEDCPPVMGHTIQMEQVVLNLLSNARDAMAKSDGESKITLRVFADTRGVYITSQDTGGGIAEDTLPRIFEPFYTTKEMGKGTGLGLSVSYGIVRDMNGTITAQNIDDGARFTITLPLVSYPHS